MQTDQLHKTLRSAVLTLFAFGFGVVTGLVGVGPAFIGAISLVYLLGLTASTARNFISTLIFGAALPAIAFYGNNGDVHWVAGLEAAIGTVLGAVIGTVVRIRRLLPFLGKVFALVLVGVAVEMILYSGHARPSGDFNIGFGVAFFVGLAAGFLGSVSAFPAGYFLSPMLALLLAVPQHGAQAIALAASIPASMPLAIRNYASSGPDKPRLLQFMVASALGGVLGAAIAVQLSSGALVIIFACFLALNAAVAFSRRSV